MNFNKTFATILTITLTAGINVSAIAAPIDTKTVQKNRVQQVEPVNEKNSKSDKNTKPSQEGSPKSKCSRLWC